VTLEEIQSTLLNLPPVERREFAQWFYEHEADILEYSDDELSPEWKAELLRRAKEMDENPSMAIPVTAEYFNNLRKKIAALGDSKN